LAICGVVFFYCEISSKVRFLLKFLRLGRRSVGLRFSRPRLVFNPSFTIPGFTVFPPASSSPPPFCYFPKCLPLVIGHSRAPSHYVLVKLHASRLVAVLLQIGILSPPLFWLSMPAIVPPGHSSFRRITKVENICHVFWPRSLLLQSPSGFSLPSMRLALIF